MVESACYRRACFNQQQESATVSLSPDEVKNLIAPIRAKHDPRLMLLASTHTLAAAGVSQALAPQGIDATASRRILAECIGAWLTLHGFTPDQYAEIVMDMNRAQTTAEYLLAIPE